MLGVADCICNQRFHTQLYRNSKEQHHAGFPETKFGTKYLGPVYTGLDKFETGPLRDLIGFVPKHSHESSPKLFQIARSFTWDGIIHQIAKITAMFVERHLVVEDESLPKS